MAAQQTRADLAQKKKKLDLARIKDIWGIPHEYKAWEREENYAGCCWRCFKRPDVGTWIYSTRSRDRCKYL